MKTLIALCLGLAVASPVLAQTKPGMDPQAEPRAGDLLQGPPPEGADGAYLLAPFIDFTERERAFFLEHVVPALTLEHPMTNAGNEDAPWYCFAYPDAVSADYGRRQVRAMRGGETLGAQLLIDTSCAAG
ncbi:hypothetical protein [Hyphobacterium marinum]|uniref:Uncharacterized protein n=1 Tax=Hyphobacterium marinum TaxID=3116574 RepID=A0ABU7LYC3_9PROT|nr:hypothetical protein [Hyphobacterium sp. Y6023]MEE2566564.1 hypothetical protein [Hyphobacterium sp. Y6023]